MELTGSQMRHLRALGHRLPVAATLGKAGLSEGVAAKLKDLLGRQELIKVRLPAGDPKVRREMGEDLARAVGAEVAGAVGRTVLLYKPNEALAPEKRVKLA
jgi:RNA-binding protein